MTKKQSSKPSKRVKPGNQPVDFSEINPSDYDEQVRPFEDVLRRLAPVKESPKDTK